MWTFEISTGSLISSTGEIIGKAYSGAPGHVDNALDEHLAGQGPIPEGYYEIGPFFHSDVTGPYVMRLTPRAGTNTYGRSDFELHGDSISHPGAASHGCIVAPYAVRLAIGSSPDKVLKVVASLTIEAGLDEADAGV